MPKINCGAGHIFMKSSSCRVCPKCARLQKNKVISSGAFPRSMGAPSLRAFANVGLKKINDVVNFSEEDLLNLHGVGPKAILELKKEMKKLKLKFKE